MVDFKILVRATCKSCGKSFKSSIPDEINMTPQNCQNVKITIEELKNYVKKTIYNLNGVPIGTLELAGFQFSIDHNCGNTNKYQVSDFEFLPV